MARISYSSIQSLHSLTVMQILCGSGGVSREYLIPLFQNYDAGFDDLMALIGSLQIFKICSGHVIEVTSELRT